MTDLATRLLAAERVARAAGALALDFFRNRERLAVEHKGKQDLVSIADREVEALVRRELSAAFPGEAFIGEEEGGAAADRVWVIDPIDGTLNFLRGIPSWAVVIAWVEDGRTELGVTYDPVHDELWTARRGHGAFRNGERITVSASARPEEAVVGLTFNFKQPAEPYAALIRQLAERGFEHRRMGSTAIQLCYVADGRIDALITLNCSSWDVLPGLLTVEEAGGQATDFVARHGFLGKGGAVASNAGLAQVVSRLADLG